jgi:transcription antitermination factor NusB
MSVIVIGAGAAGLATAIFTARSATELEVRCLDGARTIGAKILVSGGSRCNVTNRVVIDRDFWSGSPRAVRNVLRAFPADRAAGFFASLGVALHEEEDGKLFPDSNSSRTVLDALLGEAARNWDLSRMAVVDRNVLRLGCYEMLHEPDVPTKVAINEAIELGKRFSTEQSGAFVNGILDRIRKDRGLVA